MNYKVLSISEEKVIVALNEKTSFSLSPSAFALCELAIAGGGDENEVFASMATVTARDVKVFDPEKARKAAERAEKAAAVAAFETVLADWSWSLDVHDLAQSVMNLRFEQEQIEEMPFSISLEDYTKNSPSKGCEAGQFRFTYYKGTPTLVVGLNEPLPRAMVVQTEIETALYAFRNVAADEIEVPEVLRTENTAKDFDVNEDGDVVFTVKVKSGGGGNGGKRLKVEYKGVVYNSKTELGQAVNGEVKYPHKTAQALIDKGLATVLDS